MKVTSLAVPLALMLVPLGGSATLAETDALKHCVAFLAPEGVDAPWLGQADCFQSATEAAAFGRAGPPAGNLILASYGIEFCLGGAGVGLPGASGVEIETPESESPGLGAEMPCADVDLAGAEWTLTARDYDEEYQVGTYLNWYIGGTCAGTDWVSPSMPNGWDDRVSSAYSTWHETDCTSFIHYEHTNYGGDSIDCYDCVVMDEQDCGWWSSCLQMNDKTSSVRLTS